MIKCDKCYGKAVARINGRFYVCAECAEQATIESLSIGAPVIQAIKGEPKYLLIPTAQTTELRDNSFQLRKREVRMT